MKDDSTALFGRSYSLAISARGGATAVEYSNQGKDASPLRIAFEVQKSVKSSPNKATISVYNLSQESRGGIGKGALVTLAAGYGDTVSNLFLGVVQKADSTRSGADIVTKLECGDGEPALTKSTLKRSYEPNTPATTIMQDCARAMSLATAANPAPINAGTALGLPGVIYTKGYVADGLVRDILDDICKNHGLEWSIHNGALDIVPRGAHAGTEAVLLSSSTGLIGLPSLNDGALTFSALLNPGLAPNRLVRIESRDDRLNGFYKITGGKYEGDTHESKWQANMEAKALPNALQQGLVAASGFSYAGAVGEAEDE